MSFVKISPPFRRYLPQKTIFRSLNRWLLLQCASFSTTRPRTATVFLRFNVNNLEQVQAIMEAADEVRGASLSFRPLPVPASTPVKLFLRTPHPAPRLNPIRTFRSAMHQDHGQQPGRPASGAMRSRLHFRDDGRFPDALMARRCPLTSTTLKPPAASWKRPTASVCLLKANSAASVLSKL